MVGGGMTIICSSQEVFEALLAGHLVTQLVQPPSNRTEKASWADWLLALVDSRLHPISKDMASDIVCVVAAPSACAKTKSIGDLRTS